ncbi:MAG: DNA repair protein RecN [Erysipelotrichales bacterium]|nr:DNA repair protein RecN [Erysipelotrichales bacterium]
MLQTLYISNFVLIEQLQLDLQSGFSAFIGETGAGKSILMDAINLVCGERGSSDVVRLGSNKAIIEATFDMNEKVKELLEEAGIDADDFITLTREISSEGKSICRINHRVVNLGLLKDVGSHLVSVHSQFDTVSMKLNGSYIQLLDKFINQPELLETYRNTYKEYTDVVREKREFLENALSESELEILQYNADEILNAAIGENELDEIEEKMKLLQASEMIERVGNEVMELVDGNDSITDRIYSAIRLLRSVKDVNSFDELAEKLDTYYYEIKDVVEDLNTIVSSVSTESESYEELQERAFLIRKIFRKNGGSYESMMKNLDNINHQIEQYSNVQEYEAKLIQKETKLINELNKLAKELHDVREEGSLLLEKAILNELADLQLKNASFKIEVNENDVLSKDGIDEVIFNVSMNKGETLRPLLKCASGGELSRFMLGLKIVYKDIDDVDTIIFDEIDSGISGATAYTIGQKMLELSKNRQVFSVTHLAQVAASGDNVYFIDKQTIDNATYSNVTLLDENSKYEKLALIATGTISNTTISTAKEMVKTARGE